MKKWPPINEALQGCLTPDEVAAGAVAYDVDHWGIAMQLRDALVFYANNDVHLDQGERARQALSKGAKLMDPMKQQYTCEKHGDIGAAVLAIMGYDRETGETVDEFVGCVRCYVEFMRDSICTAQPVPGGPEDGESTH